MPNEAIAAEILAMADEDQRMRSEAASKTRQWDAQAEHMAWLLVQHAELDFQKECFALMARESANEVCARHLAYLEDRIRSDPPEIGASAALCDSAAEE